MGYAFLILVLLFSGINNFLLAFSMADALPAPVGFNVFAKLGHLAIIMMSFWYLGWVLGAVFFLLYILNILQACIGWVITLVIGFNVGVSDSALTDKEVLIKMLRVYSLFPFLVAGIVVFTIVSFFVADGSLKYLIEDSDNKLLLYAGIVLAAGFIIRFLVIKRSEK
jgi:hypothetical protein